MIKINEREHHLLKKNLRTKDRHNQKLELLLLMLMSVLLTLGGVLAICLGLVVAIPVIMGMWAAAYEELCGSRVPSA